MFYTILRRRFSKLTKFLLITVVITLLPLSAAAKGHILQEAVLQSPGASQSDWSAIALSVSDIPFDEEGYISQLKSYVAQKYQSPDKLSSNKSTEWHRIIIAVNLLGYDAADFSGINLINDGVYYRENLSRQGLNGYIWALIVASSGNFAEPGDAINTKESILSNILSKQNPDGSFSLSGNKPSCDITAMAVYALSFYKTQENVKGAIDNAVAYLSSVQNADGSFSEDGMANAESTAQVIIALSALRIDVNNDARFPNIYNALLSFQAEGGFCHTQGEKADVIATYQALCAVKAAKSGGWVYSNYREITKQTQLKQAKPVSEQIHTEEETKETTAFYYEETEEVNEATTPTAVPTEVQREPNGAGGLGNIILIIAVILFVILVFFVTVRRKKCGKG